MTDDNNNNDNDLPWLTPDEEEILVAEAQDYYSSHPQVAEEQLSGIENSRGFTLVLIKSICIFLGMYFQSIPSLLFPSIHTLAFNIQRMGDMSTLGGCLPIHQIRHYR